MKPLDVISFRTFGSFLFIQESTPRTKIDMSSHQRKFSSLFRERFQRNILNSKMATAKSGMKFDVFYMKIDHLSLNVWRVLFLVVKPLHLQKRTLVRYWATWETRSWAINYIKRLYLLCSPGFNVIIIILVKLILFRGSKNRI